MEKEKENLRKLAKIRDLRELLHQRGECGAKARDGGKAETTRGARGPSAAPSGRRAIALLEPVEESDDSAADTAGELLSRPATSVSRSSSRQRSVRASANAEGPLRLVSEEEARLLALEHVVRFLRSQQRSVQETRDELLRVGFTQKMTEETLIHCERALYLDDLAFARTLLEKLRCEKHLSLSAIVRHLQNRKISQENITQVLSEISDEDDWEAVCELANKHAKKLAGVPREKAERRLLAFLARRGWSRELARRAVEHALSQYNG